MSAAIPRTGVRSYLFQRSPTHWHRGVDLGNSIGAPVFAVAPGVVERAHASYTPGFSGYGRVVVVRHSDGTRALYAHLDRVGVLPGVQVEAGERIGTVGRSKFTRDDPTAEFSASRAHLHFEISRAPYPMDSEAPRIDPVAWMRSRRAVHPLTGLPLGVGDVASPLPSKPSSPARRAPALVLAVLAVPVLLLVLLTKR